MPTNSKPKSCHVCSEIGHLRANCTTRNPTKSYSLRNQTHTPFNLRSPSPIGSDIVAGPVAVYRAREPTIVKLLEICEVNKALAFEVELSNKVKAVSTFIDVPTLLYPSFFAELDYVHSARTIQSILTLESPFHALVCAWVIHQRHSRNYATTSGSDFLLSKELVKVLELLFREASLPLTSGMETRAFFEHEARLSPSLTTLTFTDDLIILF